ncbi:MAG: hypothetical protein HY075_09450 [Deltaproteobacteria bacterium]|nr:hypothetical protein [Deltaproteobacteria bacterium]
MAPRPRGTPRTYWPSFGLELGAGLLAELGIRLDEQQVGSREDLVMVDREAQRAKRLVRLAGAQLDEPGDGISFGLAAHRGLAQGGREGFGRGKGLVPALGEHFLELAGRQAQIPVEERPHQLTTAPGAGCAFDDQAAQRRIVGLVGQSLLDTAGQLLRAHERDVQRRDLERSRIGKLPGIGAEDLVGDGAMPGVGQQLDELGQELRRVLVAGPLVHQDADVLTERADVRFRIALEHEPRLLEERAHVADLLFFGDQRRQDLGGRAVIADRDRRIDAQEVALVRLFAIFLAFLEAAKSLFRVARGELELRPFLDGPHLASHVRDLPGVGNEGLVVEGLPKMGSGRGGVVERGFDRGRANKAFSRVERVVLLALRELGER